MRRSPLHKGHLVTFAVVGLLATCVSLDRAVTREGAAADGAGAAGFRPGAGLVPVGPPSIVGGTSFGLTTALFWHEALFLASEPDRPADLYRAEVRAAPGAGVFSVRGARNLTATPAGEEHGLVVAPPFAAVLTRAMGQVRAFTLLDFRGVELPPGDDWSALTRALTRLTDLKDTGHSKGVAKTTVRFVRPPSSASIDIVADRGGETVVAIDWTGRDGESHQAQMSPTAQEVEVEGLIATAEVRLPKRPILWLVDTVRSLSFVGPGPIEWAEGRFFSLRDRLRRLRYRVSGEEEIAGEEAQVQPPPPPPESTLPPGLEVGEGALEIDWPPPVVEPPVFKRAAGGEGTWRPDAPGFLRTVPDAPPAVYRTFTRPDRKRPYVRVHLFALDMRQLALHMVGGHEDPKPTTGSQGTGRIPRRPEILDRLVMAFNGAFKTEHGAYGMMVEKDVLLPPQGGAATVASLEGGRAAMGSWPEGAEIPEWMTSLRQNMDPLVEDGVVNPRRRYLWGFTLDEDIKNMNTIRSGICLTEQGTLIYAWGEDLTARTLGVAMNAAGCVYGMHLDMNPFHTAFIYYRFADEREEGKRPEFDAKLGLSEMRFSPHRYVNGAPKDFFFLTLKDPSPGPGWSAVGIAQPRPAFMPAVFEKTVDGCRLLAVDRTRATVELAPGRLPEQLAPPSYHPRGRPSEDVLATLELGRWSAARGQLVYDAVVASLTPRRPTLAVTDRGAVVIGEWPVTAEGGRAVNAVQARWPGHDRDASPAGAVGLLGDRWLLLGEGSGGELRRVITEEGGRDTLLFALPDGNEALAVRREHGMRRPGGEDKPAGDADAARLRVLARPRPLGMSRLEELLQVKGGP